jgi:hypothetical protein
MILRRLAEALRRQDWVTVTLEFFIVVVGIFVGLQVDGWNEARNNRALEHQYLGRLLADTQWNIENFLELESIFESKAAFINSLRNEPAVELLRDEPAEFLQSFDHSTYISLPSVRMDTFSELESSGRISLLRNVELRAELSSFYANYQLMQEILDEPVGDYKRLVFETVPGDVFYQFILSDDPDIDVIRKALTRLQTDARFEAAANAEITYAADLIFWLRQHRMLAENILALIGEPARNP